MGKTFYTIVYFFVLLFLLNLMIGNLLNIQTNLSSALCLVIALVGGVGLADYTVKKRSNRRK